MKALYSMWAKACMMRTFLPICLDYTQSLIAFAFISLRNEGLWILGRFPFIAPVKSMSLNALILSFTSQLWYTVSIIPCCPIHLTTLIPRIIYPSSQTQNQYLSSDTVTQSPYKSCSYQQMSSMVERKPQSEDEFEAMPEETITVQPDIAPPTSKVNPKYRPRNKILMEKQKLALVVSSTPPQMPSPTLPVSRPPHGKVIKVGSATFRSNFECGNIGSVEISGPNSYTIGLDYELNSGRTNSWFYFTCQGIKGETHFTIRGFGKRKSLYNQGLKVCYREGKDSKWRRGGFNISYEPYLESQDIKVYQLKYSFSFRYNNPQTVSFAAFFPYGLSQLNSLISFMCPKVEISTLGKTVQDRNIPLITLGNPESKKVIVLSSRVHPGQTASSLLMEGCLRQLVSDTPHANYLRQKYLFKVVPMINIDGVQLSNYRFSASGVDLNRRWKNPSETAHPQIHHLKQMILQQAEEREVVMYIDMHCHSRKKNLFFYGCIPHDTSDDPLGPRVFPYIMSKVHHAYSYFDCSFAVQKGKEGTARITLWKKLKINEIYTLEASFMGADGGTNYLESDYEKAGRKLCQGIAVYFAEPDELNSSSSRELFGERAARLAQLQNNPELRAVGQEDNSGSDSQPQKGQMMVPQPIKQSCKGSPRKQERIRSGKMMTQSLKRHDIGEAMSLTIKKEDSELIRPKATSQMFYPIPCESRTATQSKYIRVSTIARQSYKVARVSYTEEKKEDTRNADRVKNNLLNGWQGAQYRRIKKMTEQNVRRDPSFECQVKGLQGQKLQVTNSRSLIPRLPSSQPNSKYRRTSADTFYKKVIQTHKTKVKVGDISVQCRGKQIYF